MNGVCRFCNSLAIFRHRAWYCSGCNLIFPLAYVKRSKP